MDLETTTLVGHLTRGLVAHYVKLLTADSRSAEREQVAQFEGYCDAMHRVLTTLHFGGKLPRDIMGPFGLRILVSDRIPNVDALPSQTTPGKRRAFIESVVAELMEFFGTDD